MVCIYSEGLQFWNNVLKILIAKVVFEIDLLKKFWKDL